MHSTRNANWSFSNSKPLPPPPYGKSTGHGIVRNNKIRLNKSDIQDIIHKFGELDNIPSHDHHVDLKRVDAMY